VLEEKLVQEENQDLWVHLENQEIKDKWDLKEILDHKELQDHKDLRVQWERLVAQEVQVHKVFKDLLDKMVKRVFLVQMVNQVYQV
jgi:hypothetical protein